MSTDPATPTSSLNSALPTSELEPGGIRLQWSPWSRCESSFGLLLVPARPGVFVLAEQVAAMAEAGESKTARMLAIFYVGAADDLARSLSRLFAATSPLREKLANTACYLRFAPVDDAAQRQSVAAALGKWFAQAATRAETSQADAALPAGLDKARVDAGDSPARATVAHDAVQDPPTAPAASSSLLIDCDPGDEQASTPVSTPPLAGGGARATEVAVRRRPAPFPAGF